MSLEIMKISTTLVIVSLGSEKALIRQGSSHTEQEGGKEVGPGRATLPAS